MEKRRYSSNELIKEWINTKLGLYYTRGIPKYTRCYFATINPERTILTKQKQKHCRPYLQINGIINFKS